MTAPSPNRLRSFILDLGGLLDAEPDEPRLLEEGAALLGRLVAQDDWLPDAFAQPDPQRYRQYLLHCDSRERFSVVSFVWGPGQFTPVHDHTVWGLIGVLRGGETSRRFQRDADGLSPLGDAEFLGPGQVEAVSPSIGDLHQVHNAYDDRPSVSIHVYGANIGRVRRSTFDAAGTAKPFISGYSNDLIPNVWGAEPIA